MEIAAILALILLDYVDFILILLLLITNATIGYVEESSADNAIAALTASLAPRAKALRDGKFDTVDAAALVPGDVILIRLGDVLPADVKILGDEHDEVCAALHCNRMAVRVLVAHCT
jgi:H+-transporting ATPase